MKFFNTIGALMLCCLLTLSTAAQNYGVQNLPAPQNLSPLFFGSVFSSRIFYGATPPNLDPKKPVIVYVHGFTDLSNGWFTGGNDVYGETYRNGQNCAFVAMTRGHGMWTNGWLLASMLDHITNHFGVRDVVIVAHSNGGKASEVAMFWHNRRDKVERVITLGTPFGGTQLADVAELPGLSWIIDLIGLRGGTSTSTTYYMGGYARPLFDGHWRNQPGKFINFGSWGYNNGSGVIGLVMTASGAILNTQGAGPSNGGNDGVTPYWSSTRPGGRPQWVPGHGNPISRYNHFDVANSRFVWNDIVTRFSAPLSSLRLNTDQMPQAEEVNRIIESRNQFLNSEENQNTFMIEQGLREVQMNVLHYNAADQFALEQETAPNVWEATAVQVDDLRKTTAFNNGQATLIHLSSLPAGRYRLVSEAKFAGIVSQAKGVELAYDNSHQFGFDAQPKLQLQVNRAEQYDLTDLEINAVITLKHNLMGEAVDEQVFLERFKVNSEGNATLVPSQHLPVGVYNVFIQAKHPLFQKSLATGFVVRENKASANREVPTLSSVEVFPNPASRILNLRLNNEIPATIAIYSLQGSILYQQNVSSIGKQQVAINLQDLGLTPGTYFAEVQEGKQKKAISFIVAY